MPAPVFGGELWLCFIFVPWRRGTKCRSARSRMEALPFCFNRDTNGLQGKKPLLGWYLLNSTHADCQGEKISFLLVPEGLTNPEKLLVFLGKAQLPAAPWRQRVEIPLQRDPSLPGPCLCRKPEGSKVQKLQKKGFLLLKCSHSTSSESWGYRNDLISGSTARIQCSWGEELENSSFPRRRERKRELPFPKGNFPD